MIPTRTLVGPVVVVALLALAGCGSTAARTSAITTSQPPPTTAASSTTTSSTAPPSTTTLVAGPPTLVDDCGGGAYRPTTLYIICGQAKLTATEIKWRSWTADEAQGTATMSVIVCQPSCSQGHEELLPANITLTVPKPTSRGAEFTTATITWSGRSPSGRPVDTYRLQTS